MNLSSPLPVGGVRPVSGKAARAVKAVGSGAVGFVSKYGLFVVAVGLLASTAFGGAVGAAGGNEGGGAAGGAPFEGIYTMLVGWITGTLGKLLAVAAFLIGMAIGVVKQSAMAIVIGLTFALVLAFGPSLIEGVFTFALI